MYSKNIRPSVKRKIDTQRSAKRDVKDILEREARRYNRARWARSNLRVKLNSKTYFFQV